MSKLVQLDPVLDRGQGKRRRCLKRRQNRTESRRRNRDFSAGPERFFKEYSS